ncbi:MAG: DsbA family oxidoreductase [Solirubrobacteraceae bacterium]|jgi:predicted DsbA family dithiol-disulfide isomerase
MIAVDVWSDIACPWCYIGKRNLEAGIAAFRERHPGEDVEVTYHSFELSPDTPVDFDGSELDFLVRHKGASEEQATAMLERVTGIAAAAGLEYRFGDLKHTNSRKAHELLHHAAVAGRQADVKEALLRAYFTEGRHLGREDVLADIAAETGLNRVEALRALRSGTHAAAVDADVRQAYALGINAVPFYVLDRRFGLSGAQPPEIFLEALERTLEARTSPPAA